MDKDQNQIVEEKYRYIEYLFKNYFIATDENGKLGVINSSGDIILDMKYSFLQKIKGKNIVQAGQDEAEPGSETQSKSQLEFYSENMEKVVEISNATIKEQDNFVIITNDETKTYLDNTGNIINDISNIEKGNLPDEIGEYKKEQITMENVYYTK